MQSLAFENVAKNVNWSLVDIFLSTPLLLEQILKFKDKYNPFEIDPKIIVFDESDLLLGDSTLQRGISFNYRYYYYSVLIQLLFFYLIKF